MSDSSPTALAGVQQVLNTISTSPRIWNVLRRLVEHGFEGEKRVIAEELAPWRDVGQRRFLDFGCGTGEFAPCFPAAHYVGIDPSPIYIRFAARTRAGRFLVNDGTNLALPAQSFDAALVLGVLHHLDDVLVHAAMLELYRVLRPGGILLIMEDVPPPDPGNLAGRAMHWLDRGGHIRNETEYRALFGAGFAVLRMYHMRSGICDYGVYVLRRDV
ncbi:MAG: class I SAM-dependent methyltransferase [Chloroflexaceae bacterium]|nr:class I SAM-dependent methyltransferase [Chloroflexaceae bacterium]